MVWWSFSQTNQQKNCFFLGMAFFVMLCYTSGGATTWGLNNNIQMFHDVPRQPAISFQLNPIESLSWKPVLFVSGHGKPVLIQQTSRSRDDVSWSAHICGVAGVDVCNQQEMLPYFQRHSQNNLCEMRMQTNHIKTTFEGDVTKSQNQNALIYSSTEI